MARTGTIGKLTVLLDVDMKQAMAKMDTFGAAVEAHGKRLRKNSKLYLRSARNYALGAAAIGVGAGFMLKQSITLDHAMVGVRKTTNLTAEEIKQLRNEFEQMSTEIPVSAEKLAEIGEISGTLGIRGVKNIRDFTEVAAKSATAWQDIEAPEAAKYLSRILRAFDLQIDKAKNLSSNLTELGNDYGAFEAEIIEAARNMAPSAAALDMQVHQVTALSTALIESGVPAKRAGTAFRSLFTAMTEKVDKVAETLDIVPSKLKELMDKDALAAVKLIIDRLKDMDSRQRRLAASTELFGRRSLRAIGTLSKSQKAFDRLNKILGSSEKSYGEAAATEEEFRKAMDDTLNKLKTLRGELGRFIRSLADELVPTLKDEVIPALSNTLEKLVEVGEKYKWLRSLIIHSVLWTAVAAALKAIYMLGKWAWAPFLIASGKVLQKLVPLTGRLKVLGALNFPGIIALSAALTSTYFAIKNVMRSIEEFREWKSAQEDAAKASKKAWKSYEKLLNGIVSKQVEVMNSDKIPEELKERYVKFSERVRPAIEAFMNKLAEVRRKQKEGKKVTKEDRKELELFRKTMRKVSSEYVSLNKEIAKYTVKQKKAEEQTKKTNESIKKLLRDIEIGADKVLKEFGDAFSTTFSGVLKGEINSFREFWTEVTNSMYDVWADYVGKMITKWIWGQNIMEGQFGGGRSLWGFLSNMISPAASAISGIGSAFSSMASAAPNAAMATGATHAQAGTMFLPGFQHGGVVPKTGPYTLHEGEEVNRRGTYGEESGITIVNVLDSKLIVGAMSGQEGKNVVVNHMTQDLLRRGSSRRVIRKETR